MPALTKPRLLPFSVDEPQPLREHWEGKFEGRDGSTCELVFDVIAQLSFFGGGLEGDGFAPAFPADQEKLTFTGSKYDHHVDFETWLDVEHLGRKPFVCIGTVDLDAGTMDGNFTVDCIDPEDCGCGGGAGRFSLRRKSDHY